MCGTEVTLGRFRNDTTAVEDLQQVVFKFPEFNKLLSRESVTSLTKIAILKEPRAFSVANYYVHLEYV